ncbi:MAG TPA: ATP-binding protein [Methylomirabilota bacterium]|nr:ATP-binding protein [Methylomirabilota bacterium]
MRIQTRLFLGTAMLVLALTAVQWWLHQRQLAAVESELSAVATAVGKDLLTGGPEVVVRRLAEEAGVVTWVAEGDAEAAAHDVHVVVVPEEAEAQVTHRFSKTFVRRPRPPAGDGGGDGEHEVEVRVEAELVADRLELVTAPDPPSPPDAADAVGAKRFVLQVVADDEGAERFLVVSGDAGQLQRIPIPVAPAVRTFRSTMQQGALVSGLVLALGLVGAAVLANRVARPLRRLADGAEAVGRGELGAQVPVTAAGEIGELQRAFNAMSTRLAELEGEREAWRRREHLAQLGDLSRGLAHTLRNPLNTLGLAVEELADGDDGRPDLVVTARSQIRRIDQWLRAFLALGAEEAAEPTREDLVDLVREVVFAAVQQGAAVELEAPEAELPVSVVPTAVRAALANLVENAAEAGPPGASVTVRVCREGPTAVVSVRDQGPGLPEDVRRRLFEPHVTTKVGGSGMGLFLARQLVVGMHDGALELEDHPQGGTMATVKLPVAEPEPNRDS